MAPREQSSTDRERRLDEAVARYLAAQASGHLPDRRQWLAQFPDLADELAEFLADLDGMQRAMARFRGSAAVPSAASAARLAAAAGADVTPFASRSPSERYRLERFHARGGMDEIWLAEDAQIGRRIAVKRLRVADPGTRERFLHETQITGQLEHPGIVPLHDLGIGEDGEPFYVMKFVQGRSFKEAISDFHAAKAAADWPCNVEFRRLLKVFVGVCDAVAYAHHRGVLHRDIKPDNIMLGSYGEALLLDWGLAKVLGQPDVPGGSSVRVKFGSSTATRAGDVVGSLAYMCLKAMAHGQDQRYASAAALAEDVERYLAGEPVSVYREPLRIDSSPPAPIQSPNTPRTTTPGAP